MKGLLNSVPRDIVLVANSIQSRPHITFDIIKLEDSYRIHCLNASLTPSRPLHRLSKEKGAVLADKVAKQKLIKKRVCRQNKRFWLICGISCYRSKTFFAHPNFCKTPHSFGEWEVYYALRALWSNVRFARLSHSSFSKICSSWGMLKTALLRYVSVSTLSKHLQARIFFYLKT